MPVMFLAIVIINDISKGKVKIETGNNRMEKKNRDQCGGLGTRLCEDKPTRLPGLP